MSILGLADSLKMEGKFGVAFRTEGADDLWLYAVKEHSIDQGSRKNCHATLPITRRDSLLRKTKAPLELHPPICPVSQ